MGCVVNTGRELSTSIYTILSDGAVTLNTANYTLLGNTAIGDFYKEKGGNGTLTRLNISQYLSSTGGTLSSGKLAALIYEDATVTSVQGDVFDGGSSPEKILGSVIIDESDWIQVEPTIMHVSKDCDLPIYAENNSTNINLAVINMTTFAVADNTIKVLLFNENNKL